MSAPTRGPTLDQMHATWLRRKKPNWPATFQEAMQHPMYSRILSIETLYVELRAIIPRTSPPAMQLERYKNRVGYWMDTDDKDSIDTDPRTGA